MSDLNVRPKYDSLEQVKKRVLKAKAKDGLYIQGCSVGKEVGKLRGILDALQEHLNNNYKEESFKYSFCLLFSIQFLSHRFFVNEKLGEEELELYEDFLKKLPERVYCELWYEFCSSLSVESYSLGFALRRYKCLL